MAPLICAHLQLSVANDTERPITVTNGICGQGGSRRLGIEMFNLSAREIVILLNDGKLEEVTGLTRDIGEGRGGEGRGITRNEYNLLYFRTEFCTSVQNFVLSYRISHPYLQCFVSNGKTLTLFARP